ncbi:ATP-binding protein [Azospirillum sp. A39]|uniref:ATP-binding protein n=1 Tax=Azospirillum sp. A39 TaxID=3462279 RepID=UPI004046306C
MGEASSFLDTRRNAAGVRRRPGSAGAALLAGALQVLGAAGLAAVAAGLAFDQDRLAWAGAAAAAAGGVALLVRVAALRRRLTHEGALVTGALDGLSAGELVCDAGGGAVFVNTAFRALAGADAGEPPLVALERTLGRDPDARAEFARVRERALAGVPASAELRLPREGQPPEWRRVQALPVAGFPGAVHWRLEDITARRELEQVMLQEQSKLADFMEHAPVGFFSVDQEGTFLFANATLAKWLECEPRDLIESGRRLHETLATAPRGAAPYDLFDAGGLEQRGELTMRGLRGRRFQASVAQSVVVADDGRTVHTRSVVRDLTPEREWAEALRLSEQRFQRFFEDAPIGIALADESGRLAECNQAFLTLIGTPAEAVIGRPLAELIEPGERPAVAERMREVLGGANPEAPLEVRLSGERDLVVQLYARRLGAGPAAAEADASAGLILHFIDLTERKSLEAQFAQSQKMQAVGQLAGGVAHDFNNLLTAMIGFCDLLLLRHKPGDQSFSDIMQIKQNANRAANLVRQLLAFSRQQTLQPRVINVTDVLAELSNLLRRLIGENIELKMIHGRDLGLVKVDQNQLEQVIINLVVNARDAMAGTGGRLSVVTSNYAVTAPDRREHEVIPPGDYVSIEVIDTGVGIPKQNLQRIFEPFFSTKEVGSGTGLGLSTVYGIVRQTGGFIFVDSAPGEGAKFTILLPRHQGQPRPVETGEPRERRGSDLTGSGTILLVEDEDAVRVFSARALRNKGYQVMEAKNGEAAMQQIGDGSRIDLLITDVVMPQMDGPTLARKVRERRPDMRVIFISGYAEDRFKDEFDGAGNAHFLPKPFSLKQLASKVKEVIRASG